MCTSHTNRMQRKIINIDNKIHTHSAHRHTALFPLNNIQHTYNIFCIVAQRIATHDVHVVKMQVYLMHILLYNSAFTFWTRARAMHRSQFVQLAHAAMANAPSQRAKSNKIIYPWGQYRQYSIFCNECFDGALSPHIICYAMQMQSIDQQ